MEKEKQFDILIKTKTTKEEKNNEKSNRWKPWYCTHTHTHTLCLLNKEINENQIIYKYKKIVIKA